MMNLTTTSNAMLALAILGGTYTTSFGAESTATPIPTTSARQWVKTSPLNTLTAHAHSPKTLVIRLDSTKPALAQAALAKVLTRTQGRIRYESSLVPGLYIIDTKTHVGHGLQAARTETDGILYAHPAFHVYTTATNDTNFNELWGLRNDGGTWPNPNGAVTSVQSTAGLDIRAEEAWQVQSNGQGVVVAVIDSGVNVNHPDLQDAIWVNTDEIAGNGIDDDGNGKVDDRNGWSFPYNSNTWPAQDHGSHTSGTIAATGNNSEGIVGVAPGASIMPVQFLDPPNNSRLEDVLGAIEYAVANGARISNNSWGSPVPSPAIEDVLAAAGAQGHLFIFAAGNNGDEGGQCMHPAAADLDCIISVGAIRPDGEVAGFSARGAGVDLAAPGWGIVSCNGNGSYSNFQGTSMAAPHVTGVAALLLAHKPDASAVQIKSAILSSVRPLDSLSGMVETGGMLDAAAALAAIMGDGGNDDDDDDNNNDAYGMVEHNGAAPQGMSLTMQPQGDSWSFCKEEGDALPAGTGGTNLNLGDEAAVWINLASPFTFNGESYNRLQVHSNGSVTFTEATADDWQSTSELFALAPRIAPMFTDLDPSAGGSVKVLHLDDRTAISWIDVPAYQQDTTNTMQLELFNDGGIRMSWTDLPAFDQQQAIIGLGGPGMSAWQGDMAQAELCNDGDTPTQGCQEDLNGNERVDVQDLIQLLHAWGECN